VRPDRPRYTFGDSPRAARRLELLSAVLAPSTRAFLADAAPVTPRVALDLGCGPGVSTRLVADVTRARRTIGVDTSRSFLQLAARSAPRGVEFVRGDATRVPLPGAPADLIYCRLLLAHVPDPVATVRAWASQLAPDGRLLVDEMEWIDAPHPVLDAYESIVVDLVASRGAPMYAGPRLAAMREGPGWRQRSSAVRAVPVAAPTAARIYAMNLMTWREDPQIRDHHSVDSLDALARDLAALTQSTSADQITWGVRQLAYERDPSALGEP
jgi:trans-aconitate 2-methyltransferase